MVLGDGPLCPHNRSAMSAQKTGTMSGKESVLLAMALNQPLRDAAVQEARQVCGTTVEPWSTKGKRAFCRTFWGTEWHIDKQLRKQRLTEAERILKSYQLNHERVIASSVVHSPERLAEGKALASYCDSTEYPDEIKCCVCERGFKGAHLYIVDAARKSMKYTVGCSHVDYDGEPWCDSCVTLTADKNGDPAPTCSGCAKVEWGRATDPCIRFWRPS